MTKSPIFGAVFKASPVRAVGDVSLLQDCTARRVKLRATPLAYVPVQQLMAFDAPLRPQEGQDHPQTISEGSSRQRSRQLPGGHTYRRLHRRTLLAGAAFARGPTKVA